MEAKEYKIQDILTENKKYIIPAYQRPYSWNPDNVEQLIDDIYQSYKSDEKEYFIGSIICINYDDNRTFEVVDGQQRLTTLILILSQIKNVIKNKNIKDDLQNRILPIDIYSDKPEKSNKPRLVIRKKEYDFYVNYILQENFDIPLNNLTEVEELFLKNIQIIKKYLKNKNEIELKSLSKYILHNVFVVFVQTDNFTSSFRLFNVLNNRGLSLSNADLIKNALFDAASRKNKDSSQVEKAWADIESMIGVRGLNKFLTLHKISKQKDRNRVIKKDLNSYLLILKEDFNNDAVKMSLSLVRSAKNYMKIINNDFEHINIRMRIPSLIELYNDECMPVLLAFLNRKTKLNNLSYDQFSNFVVIFEKVYMHGWLKKQTKGKREKVSYSSLVAINNNLPFHEIIKFVSNHSDNKGLKNSLKNDIYEPRGNQVKLIKIIFTRLYLEEKMEVLSQIQLRRVTIDHILPKKLDNEYWKEKFTKEDHAVWLNKLGNLVIINGSHNPKSQSKTFEKKKIFYNRLNGKSIFDFTKELCETSDWGKSELIKRHDVIINKIILLWSV
jgi:hypothetical protein